MAEWEKENVKCDGSASLGFAPNSPVDHVELANLLLYLNGV